jgi:hypothetical protein
MSTPTKPSPVTRDGIRYEPRLMLRHGDGSVSVRYDRTAETPQPRAPLWRRCIPLL